MFEIFIVKTPSTGNKKLRDTLATIDADYVEHDVALGVTQNQISELLKRTEFGFEELLARRSKAYKAIEHKLDDMSVNELISYIVENPTILRLPILLDVERDIMEIGYNPYTIKPFISRRKRGELPIESLCPEKRKRPR